LLEMHHNNRHLLQALFLLRRQPSMQITSIIFMQLYFFFDVSTHLLSLGCSTHLLIKKMRRLFLSPTPLECV
jgi:hypothetical protein